MATTRQREMGIRAALGATRLQFGSIVLVETGRLAGAGVTAGLFFAWLGANTIRSFLYQVEPLDPPAARELALEGPGKEQKEAVER